MDIKETLDEQQSTGGDCLIANVQGIITPHWQHHRPVSRCYQVPLRGADGICLDSQQSFVSLLARRTVPALHAIAQLKAAATKPTAGREAHGQQAMCGCDGDGRSGGREAPCSRFGYLGSLSNYTSILNVCSCAEEDFLDDDDDSGPSLTTQQVFLAQDACPYCVL